METLYRHPKMPELGMLVSSMPRRLAVRVTKSSWGTDRYLFACHGNGITLPSGVRMVQSPSTVTPFG